MKAFPKKLLTSAEKRLFSKLDTPQKIQNYLNKIPYNKTDSLRSVRRSITAKCVHCFEGAMFAAAALWYHGQEPIIFDLKTTQDDADHVVALFKSGGRYGAISATHHSVLRYRDPVYKSPRELALSYFHEYFLDSGIKTLLSFSKKPFSLLPYGHSWLFEDTELYDIGGDLDDATHEDIAPKSILKNLRKADPVERKAARLTQ